MPTFQLGNEKSDETKNPRSIQICAIYCLVITIKEKNDHVVIHYCNGHYDTVLWYRNTHIHYHNSRCYPNNNNNKHSGHMTFRNIQQYVFMSGHLKLFSTVKHSLQ